MKRFVKNIFSYFGYSITKTKKIKNGMELYEYNDVNGNFDYGKYKSIQTEGNKRKIDNVWVE